MPLSNRRLQIVLVIEIAILALAATFIIPSTGGLTRFAGQDVIRYYAPLGRGCITCGYAPYHAAFVLWPIGLMPDAILWPAWMVASVLLVAWACWRLDVNPVWVLLSFAMMSQLWLGQVDALVLAGLVLAFTARNPYARGLGLLVASVKPQIALVAILVLLWHEEERLKVLAIPIVAFIASLALWGPLWPWNWLVSQTNTPAHQWQTYTFPWGLPALSAIPFIRDRQRQVAAALWASTLALPSFASYSYIVPLAFLAPWWSIPAGFAWLLAIPLAAHIFPMRLAWLLAVVMLAYIWGVDRTDRV